MPENEEKTVPGSAETPPAAPEERPPFTPEEQPPFGPETGAPSAPEEQPSIGSGDRPPFGSDDRPPVPPRPPLSRREKLWLPLVALFTVLAAALYMLLIHYSDVWADEAYTLAMIRHSYTEMIALTAADVHPPLYYVLLKLCTQPFGYSMTAIRVFTVVPYLCIIFFGAIALRKIFNPRTGAFFALLFFCYPFAMQYSTELRMYTIAAAFVFFCGIFAMLAYSDGKIVHWVFFGIFGLAAAYTHYFALVSAGIIYLLLLIAILCRHGRGFKLWAICTAATVILYAPWIVSFLQQLSYKVENEYWIPALTVPFVLGFVRHLFGSDSMQSFVLFCCLSFLFLFLCTMIRGSKKERLASLCALIVPVGTIAVGCAASLLIRPVFVIHYVVPAVPLLVSFLAIALGRMEKRTLTSAFLAFFLFAGVENYTSTLYTEYTSRDSYIDESFTEISDRSECCVCYSTGSHIPAVVSWYAADKPVYGEAYTDVPEANAFDNLQPLEDFQAKKWKTVTLVVDAGDDPDNYVEDWVLHFEGSFTSEDQSVDVYTLRR